MRITGGRMRGRRLAAPKSHDIRPTSDRVREAVFSVIGQDLEGIFVLDLFAGTGALGIEALSRGGSKAVFVDNSPKALELIRRNLVTCGLEDNARTIRWDLSRGIPGKVAVSNEKFDLVFLDPPYGLNLALPVLKSLGLSDCLSPDVLIVVETSSGETLDIPAETFARSERRQYGDTAIHLFSRYPG